MTVNKISPLSKDNVKVFLAGTIEMGKSVDWQTLLTNKIIDASYLRAMKDVTILNPRRVLAPGSDEISEQIQWELNNIQAADVIFIHFAADSISPISLLELGLILGRSTNYQLIIVCCNREYTRYDNVYETISHKYFGDVNNMIFLTDMEQAVDVLLTHLEK